MNTSSNSKKILVAGIVVLVLVFGVYYVFFRATPVVVSLDEFGNPTETKVVGQDLIDLSKQLEAVTLDGAAFKKKTFTNLVDYSVNLPSDEVGRRNPFDPIGSSGTNVSDLVAAIIKSI